ncbi:MAG: hypothetical protein ACQESP_10805 [Candidatus Muiribacteriota bacterium]
MNKIVFLMTIDSLSEKVHKFLEDKVDMYFEIPAGRGKYKYYHRMNTAVWPGAVNGFIIPIKEEKLSELKNNIKEFMNSIETEHYFSMIVLPVEDFIMFQGNMEV